MYLVINKCVTAVEVSNFSGHYLRNRSTLDIGVLGYIGIVQHKEHSPEILSIPPGTPCIHAVIYLGHYTSNLDVRLNIFRCVFSLRNANLGRYQGPRNSIVFVANSNLAARFTYPTNFEVLCKFF